MQIAVAECQQSGKHPALIALLAFAFQIHLTLGGYDGLDIVGLPQRFHPHIIIHAQQNVFQIGTCKTVFRNLPDTAVLHIAAEKRTQYSADLRFSFAAVSLHHHHALPFVAGNQTITNKLLQGGDVLRIQKPIQKRKPEGRC